jgi:8-oxo-dGTP pyrophosphatase MutT (NUDIX family)
MTAYLADPVGNVAGWRAAITQRLTDWERSRAAVGPATRRAAVAVTLIDRSDTAHVLLLKRVPRGLNPGQWALPGGKADGEEDVVETALRELEEETGLRAAPTDVLGLLDDFVTVSGYVITPVIVAPPGDQRPIRRPTEIASLHPIPVARLLAPGVPRWRKTATGGRLLQMPLRHDMVVHAPTGAILWQFAEVGLRGASRRVADVLQPDFTAH